MTAQNDAAVLLDCTLRDGSYAIGFQFTSRDTQNLVSGLAKAGLAMIEVGHGLGLGASGTSHGIAFENDRAYIAAAKKAAGDAKIGAFFIPGIGSLDDITAARDVGLDFIRVGSNVDRAHATAKAVEKARALGLIVHLNLMKVYAVTPDELAKIAAPCRDWGLDCIYAVDSAGCMLPGQVARYVSVLREACAIPVGFHGHNNLDLANANCLAALDAGARYVDATLRGMGRSSGNAQTEVLAHLMRLAGYEANVDPFVLFDVIENHLQPLMITQQGQSSLDVVIGMSKFHSAFLARFRRALDTYDVDLLRLINEVSRIDCVDPQPELIDRIARDMSRRDV